MNSIKFCAIVITLLHSSLIFLMLGKDIYGSIGSILLMNIIDEYTYIEAIYYWNLKSLNLPKLFEFQHHFHHFMSFLSYISQKIFGNSLFAIRIPVALFSIASLIMLMKCIQYNLKKDFYYYKNYIISKKYIFCILAIFPIIGTSFIANSVRMYPAVFSLFFMLLGILLIFLWESEKFPKISSYMPALLGINSAIAFLYYASNVVLVISFFIITIIYVLIDNIQKNEKVSSKLFRSALSFCIGVTIVILGFHIFLEKEFNTSFWQAYLSLKEMFGHRANLLSFTDPFFNARFIFNWSAFFCFLSIMLIASIHAFYLIRKFLANKEKNYFFISYISVIILSFLFFAYIQSTRDPGIYNKNFQYIFLISILASFLIADAKRVRDGLQEFLNSRYNVKILLLPISYFISMITLKVIYYMKGKYFFIPKSWSFYVSFFFIFFILLMLSKKLNVSKKVKHYLQKNNVFLLLFFYCSFITILHIVSRILNYKIAFYSLVYYESMDNLIVNALCLIGFIVCIYYFINQRMSNFRLFIFFPAFLFFPDLHLNYKYIWKNINSYNEQKSIDYMNIIYKNKYIWNLPPFVFSSIPVSHYYEPKFYLHNKEEKKEMLKLLSADKLDYIFCTSYTNSTPLKYGYIHGIFVERKHYYLISTRNKKKALYYTSYIPRHGKSIAGAATIDCIYTAPELKDRKRDFK